MSENVINMSGNVRTYVNIDWAFHDEENKKGQTFTHVTVLSVVYDFIKKGKKCRE